jgi:hypothetical protein
MEPLATVAVASGGWVTSDVDLSYPQPRRRQVLHTSNTVENFTSGIVENSSFDTVPMSSLTNISRRTGPLDDRSLEHAKERPKRHKKSES